MKLSLYTYIFWFVFCSASISQTKNINNIRLYSVDGELTVHPNLNDFFTDDILSAINSGMNVTFHFYSELYDTKENFLEDQENQIHVRNDIWENQYTISSYKFLKRFKSFDNFKNFLLDSIQFNLNISNKINENKKLLLLLTFSPKKISISQKEKIRSWLKNEDYDSESTLSLNLSKLISFFMSEEKNENLSVFKSEIFTFNSIKTNAKTKK